MRLNPRAALPHARAALLSPRATLRRLPFRTRLAAAICTLFLAAGIALLTFVVLLARHGTDQQVQGMAIARSDHGPTDPRSPFTSVPVPPDAARPNPTTPRPNPTTPRPNPTTPRSNPVTPRPVGVATRPVGVVPRPYDVAEVWKIDQSVRAVQETALRQMVLWSAVGLLVMAVLAGLLGWWLAGRALRPVVSMTEAARRISEQNLHQRLALDGPPDELHLLADTFDTMLDRLEKSFESRRRFVANASHELKTPLAVQRTSLQVGLADPLPDGLAEVREDLLDANREAEQLIDALLLLARSDRGLTRTARVDLAATARRVTTRLAAQATRRGLRLDLDVTPEGAADTPPLVHGDPVLLSHLLTNLVHNAVQYNHPGGHVRVRLGTRTVTVTNTGPDIPPERIPDLFEPFQRLGPSRTATTGHGLGLSIAHSIAEAHHATLTARPGPEGGLVVTVRFP